MAREVNIAGQLFQDAGTGWFRFDGRTVGAAMPNSMHEAAPPAMNTKGRWQHHTKDAMPTSWNSTAAPSFSWACSFFAGVEQNFKD